jgi:hypothetical protein
VCGGIPSLESRLDFLSLEGPYERPETRFFVEQGFERTLVMAHTVNGTVFGQSKNKTNETKQKGKRKEKQGFSHYFQFR